MAMRREPWWCSSISPSNPLCSSHSPTPRKTERTSTSTGILASQNFSSSSEMATQFAESISSVNSSPPAALHSRTNPPRHVAVGSNARGPGGLRRREVCFILGLAVSELGRNEAEALDGDDDVRDPSTSAEVGLENGKLRNCEGSAPCVSTSAFRSPGRFMPPWQYLGPQNDAYGELLKALKRMGAKIMKTEGGRYVYATMSTSASKEDIDDLEFLFVDKVVCFRSFSRKTALDPPFCWWPGCINGPGNRGRMEALRDDLGWIPLETDEDKAWTPMFLH